MFIPEAHLIRAAAFDRVIEDNAELLQHPEFVGTFGALAGKLEQLNSQLALPDIHHGQAKVTRLQRRAGKIAFLPVSDEEAADLDFVFDNASNNLYGQRIILPESVYYDMADTRLDSYSLLRGLVEESEAEEDDEEDEGGMPEGNEAVTWMGMEVYPKAYAYDLYQPLMAYKQCYDSVADKYTRTAVTLHELSHLYLGLELGPFYNTARGQAMAELLGYRVTNILCGG